jgi:hypothetical protein
MGTITGAFAAFLTAFLAAAGFAPVLYAALLRAVFTVFFAGASTSVSFTLALLIALEAIATLFTSPGSTKGGILTVRTGIMIEDSIFNINLVHATGIRDESISNRGLRGLLLNLRLLFSLHSRIPTNECPLELVIEYLRPHLE